MILSVGILHPGNMGISLAASAKHSGHQVYWASDGRSLATHARAAEHDLEDAGDLQGLAAACDLIISICPPHAAEEVAAQVRATGYSGLYVDANAISPERVKRIGRAMRQAGISFVDGGVVGGPAWEPGRTWLYLSGQETETVVACFAAGPLETGVIGESIGKASALKMCYAAYTKGTTALLCAIVGTADANGVLPELENQWARWGSGFPEQTRSRTTRSTAKAWRFVGEMEEIAATFEEAGLPGGFHTASADIYRRLAHLKDRAHTPSFEELLTALAQGDDA